MPNGNGNKIQNWILGIVAAVTVSAVVGGVKFAMGQSETNGAQDTRISAVETSIEARADAVESIDVIENEVAHLNGKVDDMDKRNIEAHKEILREMEKSNNEILRAIDGIHKHSGGGR